MRSNAVANIFWAFIFGTALLLAGKMILAFWQEADANAISTTFATTFVHKLPFPAIGVDMGVINPWGYLTKFYDHYDFMVADDVYGSNKDHGLRSHFPNLIQKVFGEIEEEWRNRLLNMEVDEIQALSKRSAHNHPILNGFKSQMSHSVAILASLWEKIKEESVIRRVLDTAEDAFGRISKDDLRKIGGVFGEKAIFPILVDTANENNWTIRDYRRCFTDNSDCKWYKRSYCHIIAPLLTLEMPMESMRMGQFMQFFTRFFIQTSKENKIESTRTDFLDAFTNTITNQMPSFERDVKDEVDILSRALDTNRSSEMKPLNLFDLVRLATYSDSGYPDDITAMYLMYTFNCINTEFKFERAWRVFLDKVENFSSARGTLKESDFPCSPSHHDFIQLQSCCNLRSAFRLSYRLILKSMKYAVQMPHFLQSQQEHDQDFEPELTLAQRPFQREPPSALDLQNYDPRIFMCQWNRKPKLMQPDNCHLFRRRFSNQGIAYVFNSGYLPLRKTRTNAIFTTIMLNDNDNNDNSTADVLYPLANGVDEGLTVILRTNPNMNWKDPSQTFKIAIGSPGDLLDFRVGAAELDPGHSYTFQIFSSEVTTSTQVKELPLFKRDCRTRSESADMKIFEEYTQSGCILECQLQRARQVCGCIPWNFPQINGTSEVCTTPELLCVDSIMESSQVSEQCTCPFDCDKVSYSFYYSSMRLDPDKICSDTSEMRQILGSPHFIRNSFFNEFEDFVANRGDATRNFTVLCREQVPNLAIIKFQMASRLSATIHKELRVTLADYVSNFGGTLGLFTGISAVKLIEICLSGLTWACKKMGLIRTSQC